MGKNLSPVLRRELANLEKDADSRKNAMKNLKSYVEDLDSKAIPLFLAQVSETKDAGSSSVEYTISLYEVLARVHGPNIVPQIDIIMGTIIKTLTTSGGSFPLQQACSKVVPAIARYGIEPTTPETKRRHIIHSLCKPLSDSLLGTQESLSSGAALCLKALVDCANWRFSSDEMVNDVCVKLAGSLEDKPTQTISHMGLVMSLAKHNSLIVEAYARLLIQSGLRILNAGTIERNSQKRLTAIQMINFLMKVLDIRSIFSELGSIIEDMEKCQSDQMRYVAGAAFEALQTARRLLADKGHKFDSHVFSVTGSNFGGSDYSPRSYQSSGDRSPASVSPESQILDSFGKNDSFVESPISTSQASCNLHCSRNNGNGKFWNYDNGCVNISLKDGLFSELVSRGAASHEFWDHDEGSDGRRVDSNGFAGFVPGSRVLRSHTPSYQKSCSQVNVDNIRIFTTPRRLLRSLQDENDEGSDYCENHGEQIRSPCSVRYPERRNCPNGLPDGINHSHANCYGVTTAEDLDFKSDFESVSSTDDFHVEDEEQQRGFEVSPLDSENKSQNLVKVGQKRSGTCLKNFFAIFFGLFAISASLLLFGGDGDQGCHLVPT